RAAKTAHGAQRGAAGSCKSPGRMRLPYPLPERDGALLPRAACTRQPARRRDRARNRLSSLRGRMMLETVVDLSFAPALAAVEAGRIPGAVLGLVTSNGDRAVRFAGRAQIVPTAERM